MKILSHRGFWVSPEEKNTLKAFERSFRCGFGTETDIRDAGGKLVISHDVPSSPVLSCGEFFDLYKRVGHPLPLALNIKSDGLQGLLQAEIGKYQIENYFLFDMSVPDGLLYIRRKLRTFTRQSEYESCLPFYKEAAGVWLDEFHSDWITETTLSKHVTSGKEVCIVSPDLHQRECCARWEMYRNWGICHLDNVMICTDYPKMAGEFFYGKN